MRAEIANAAFEVMLDHGYDALTVEELAKAVGISRATFFRYFGSKDEVITAAMLEPADVFEQALAATPPAPGETKWQRLRVALEPSVPRTEKQAQRRREQIRLVQAQPLLGARLRRGRFPQIERLAEALVGEGLTPMEASTLATAAIAVLDHSLSQWARQERASFRRILDDAFRCLAAASET